MLAAFARRRPPSPPLAFRSSLPGLRFKPFATAVSAVWKPTSSIAFSPRHFHFGRDSRPRKIPYFAFETYAVLSLPLSLLVFALWAEISPHSSHSWASRYWNAKDATYLKLDYKAISIPVFHRAPFRLPNRLFSAPAIASNCLAMGFWPVTNRILKIKAAPVCSPSPFSFLLWHGSLCSGTNFPPVSLWNEPDEYAWHNSRTFTLLPPLNQNSGHPLHCFPFGVLSDVRCDLLSQCSPFQRPHLSPHPLPSLPRQELLFPNFSSRFFLRLHSDNEAFFRRIPSQTLPLIPSHPQGAWTLLTLFL